MKITITRSSTEISNYSGSVKFSNLTEGQMLALLNALQERSEKSPVCNDVYNQFNNEVCDKWSAVLS